MGEAGGGLRGNSPIRTPLARAGETLVAFYQPMAGRRRQRRVNLAARLRCLLSAKFFPINLRLLFLGRPPRPFPVTISKSQKVTEKKKPGQKPGFLKP